MLKEPPEHTLQAVFACWITGPMNRLLGRRGVIFWSCVIAGAASIWEAFTSSWPQLFVARLALGLGIGAQVRSRPAFLHFFRVYDRSLSLLLSPDLDLQSATAPIYTGKQLPPPILFFEYLALFSCTAECAPAPIRGALVMQWQMVRSYTLYRASYVNCPPSDQVSSGFQLIPAPCPVNPPTVDRKPFI